MGGGGAGRDAGGVAAGAGEQLGDGAGGGAGDGSVEGDLVHGLVPHHLDVERGEQGGLEVFAQLVQAPGQFGQFVQQVDAAVRLVPVARAIS